MRIKMVPQIEDFKQEENGIRRVVEAYLRYLPEFGYTLTDKSDPRYDLIISHAGAAYDPDILVCHGLYWTADYTSPRWEREVNKAVIAAARYARAITVPSAWVGEVFRRDMHIAPTILPHGIEAADWQHSYASQGYVLWNKNRSGIDVCNTHDAERLAVMRPKTNFLSTFATHEAPANFTAVGLMAHAEMKKTVQQAGVYLSTTKETFGIGILEAMASGVPVLGWNFGGNRDLVQHGVNGYLAEYGDYDGLASGLDYCLTHRRVLGANGQALARGYTWQNAVAILSRVIDSVAKPTPAQVSVVIPCYNYADKVERAILSAKDQTFLPEAVIVVDDGSKPEQSAQIKAICERTGVTYLHKENGGVATARNYGIAYATTPYIACLDADDAIAPRFLEACMEALVHDPSLGVAYTGLTWVKADGSTGLSQWPGEYDYDAFLRRQNQVPTCCVFRRAMWERLGGYDQRYAPSGAGAEDAEFFLRAGALGFGAKKVTDEGLFIYSWGTGQVSGDTHYHEMDWTELHPWTRDGQHPFASLATPKSFSHPVRQYDQPQISVVIPVGPGHEKEVHNALDSLESQTLRKWEAICVFDNWDGQSDTHALEDRLAELETAYPFIRTVINRETHKGAGWARNQGAKIARAPFLLFLDADDWLTPTALERMASAWRATGGIIYSDYVGKATITEEYARQLQESSRLLDWNSRTHEAVMRYQSAEYDCHRAQSQPDPADMYIWNLITSLVPKSWHVAIGGFDEQMPSWEDWDYWIRLARAGYCFHRIPEQLVVYRFATGTRRETGLHAYPHLIQYLKSKYQTKEGGKLMPCTSCGGGKPDPAQATLPVQSVVERQIAVMSDADFVLVDYRHGNLGQHPVIGPATHTNYGYRGGGDQFYVHQLDIEAAPDLFVPVHQESEVVQPTVAPPAPAPLGVSAIDEPVVQDELVSPPTPTPPPPVLKEPQAGNRAPRPSRAKTAQAETPTGNDLQKIPGVSDSVARELNAAGVYSVEDLRALDTEALKAIKGIGGLRAETIYDYLHHTDKADE